MQTARRRLVCYTSMKISMLNHLQNHRAKLSRVIAYLNNDSLAAYCSYIDPRACELKLWSKSEREKIETNFISYGVKQIKRWKLRQQADRPLTGQQEEPSTENRADFAAKRTKPDTGFRSRTYAVTDFGSSDESDKSEDESITDKDGREIREAIVFEHQVFRERAAEFRRSLRATSKQDERKQVMDWWRSHSRVFPTLSIIACVLFSVRISSASAERMFSYAGLIKTARRNKMSAHLFDALMTFAYNDPVLQRLRKEKRGFRDVE